MTIFFLQLIPFTHGNQSEYIFTKQVWEKHTYGLTLPYHTFWAAKGMVLQDKRYGFATQDHTYC